MGDSHAAVVRGPGEGEANGAFGLRRVFKVTEADSGGAFVVFEENIPEGAGPPLHIHHREHEVFTVLEGRIRFRCEGRDFDAEPGTVVMIPPGAPHAFKGIGPGLSRALVTLTPGGAGGFFATVEREGLKPPADMARIREIAATFGLEFVGPPL